jgi:hypothetical protein
MVSNNILSNFSNEIFYRYNRNELSHGFGLTTAYGGLFPVLNVGAEYTFDRHINTSSGEYILNQMELRGGFYIPLNFTSGNTAKFLNFGSQVVFNRLSSTARSKDQIDPETLKYLSHFAVWQQQLPRAPQHIYPKLGYVLSNNYRHRFPETGFQYLGLAQTYLPAFAKNHSIVLTGVFQETDTNNIVFSNRFPGPRGYPEYYLSRMWRTSANYHFPIAYPDVGFANIAYLMRLRGNLFYDYGRVYSPDKSNKANLRSTGAELFFDTQWWNQLPITIGIRYSYLLDNELSGETNRHRFEFVVPLDLIPD